MSGDKMGVPASPSGHSRAEPEEVSALRANVPNAALGTETAAKDIEHLRMLYEKTGGKAWEPPAPNYPWLVRMIAAGFLRRCTMRCGFEAFDSGVTWTDAGHFVMRAPASAIEAQRAATVQQGAVADESAAREAGDAQ